MAPPVGMISQQYKPPGMTMAEYFASNGGGGEREDDPYFGIDYTRQADIANTESAAGIINGIDFGSIPAVTSNAQSVDDIIRQSKPAAENILRAGTGSALDFSRQSQAGVEDQLSQFLNPQALEEQSALLGARGADAQRAAIAGIPISAAQREAERRQTIGLQRRAAAGGELGAGSTMLASGQLAGMQQADRVASRVEQLEQLAGIDRQLLGDISRNRESEMSRRAALQGGLGGQIANVGLGLAGSAVESIQTQADIAGLRGISKANQSAQNASSIANLAGQVFTPSNMQAVGNMFSSSPQQSGPTYIPQQQGYTGANYSPVGSGNTNYSPAQQINWTA